MDQHDWRGPINARHVISGNAELRAVCPRPKPRKDKAVVSPTCMVPRISLCHAIGLFRGEEGVGGASHAAANVGEEPRQTLRAGLTRPAHAIGEALDAQIDSFVQVEGEGEALAHVAIEVASVGGEKEVEAAVCEKGV